MRRRIPPRVDCDAASAHIRRPDRELHVDRRRSRRHIQFPTWIERDGADVSRAERHSSVQDHHR